MGVDFVRVDLVGGHCRARPAKERKRKKKKVRIQPVQVCRFGKLDIAIKATVHCNFTP